MYEFLGFHKSRIGILDNSRIYRATPIARITLEGKVEIDHLLAIGFFNLCALGDLRILVNAIRHRFHALRMSYTWQGY